MAQPLVDDLKTLEFTGVSAYDAFLGEEVLVIAPVICVICDNPRCAEIMNHSGSSATMFCRVCMVSIVIEELPCTLMKSILCRQINPN